MGGEGEIEGEVADAEGDAGYPEIADTVQDGPFGVVATEGGFGFFFMEEVVHVDVLCFHRHGPDVFEEMGGVGIFFGVAIGVMHTVQDGVGAGIQEGGPL